MDTALSQTELFSALKLATKWRFEDLRNTAIQYLTALITTPLDMIAYGKKYMVPQWPVEGYRRIIKGSYPTFDTASVLGPKYFYHLMSVRDEYWASKSAGSLKHKKSGTPSRSFDTNSKIVSLIERGELEGAIPPDSTESCVVDIQRPGTLDA